MTYLDNKWLKGRYLLLGGVVLAAIAFALVVSGVGTSGNGSAVANAGTVSPAHSALASSFSMLGTTDVIDKLPSRAAVLGELGFDLAEARPSGVSIPGGGPIWIVPGTSKVCLLEVDPDALHANCATVSQAQSGQLRGYRVPVDGGGQTVVGLAPDTNPTVAVQRADGTTQDVAVHNNVYVATDATSVDVRDAAGTIHSLATR